jgi:hypothetical protein
MAPIKKLKYSINKQGNAPLQWEKVELLLISVKSKDNSRTGREGPSGE